MAFAVCAVVLILGIGLFNLGADLAMMPMGINNGYNKKQANTETDGDYQEPLTYVAVSRHYVLYLICKHSQIRFGNGYEHTAELPRDLSRCRS